MQIPLGLGFPVFYLMSMKNSILVSSLPRAPDLELENDITILGISMVTSRVGACRSGMVITSMGEEFAITLNSNTKSI